jgi:hypothetical protein
VGDELPILLPAATGRITRDALPTVAPHRLGGHVTAALRTCGASRIVAARCRASSIGTNALGGRPMQHCGKSSNRGAE